MAYFIAYNYKMSLLDLDTPWDSSSSGSLPIIPEFQFLLPDINLDSFDSLEQAAQSFIILRSLFSDNIKRYDFFQSFFRAFSQTLLEETKGRLKYNIFDNYPHVCARCFSYFGDCVGGAIRYYCVYCPIDEENKSKFTTDSLLPSFTPYTSILFGQAQTEEDYFMKMHYNTIFTARLIYKIARG